MADEWKGTTPVFLVIRSDEGHIISIDLDEHGWSQTYREWLRVPGFWELSDKTGKVWLRVTINEGEQGYYKARHVGIAGSGGSNEVVAYGLGKKRSDNTTSEMWLLPDGSVTANEDLERIALGMVRKLGPRFQPE